MDMPNTCTGTKAQLIKMTVDCPCKKLSTLVAHTCNPNTGEAESGGAQSLLVNQFSQIGKLQIHQEILFWKLRWRMINETQCQPYIYMNEIAAMCNGNIYSNPKIIHGFNLMKVLSYTQDGRKAEIPEARSAKGSRIRFSLMGLSISTCKALSINFCKAHDRECPTPCSPQP